jgi:hypothetical protein
MASVSDLKDALDVEREKAAILADHAIQAVSTVSNLGSFWLQVLGVELAVLALIGLAAVYLGARRAARLVAESRINTHIDSLEGKRMIREAIAEEVAAQIEQRSFILVQPTAAPAQPGTSFPVDPKGGQA